MNSAEEPRPIMMNDDVSSRRMSPIEEEESMLLNDSAYDDEDFRSTPRFFVSPSSKPPSTSSLSNQDLMEARVRLTFSDSEDDDDDRTSDISSPSANRSFNSASPMDTDTMLHRQTNRIEALSLIETPSTPKSLFRRCRRIPRDFCPPKKMDSQYYPEKINNSPKHVDELAVNTNPFSRIVSSPSETSALEDLKRKVEISPEYHEKKRQRIIPCSQSRFEEDFQVFQTLGEGEFGKVLLCRRRLDGMDYAVKRLRRPKPGSLAEKQSLNEIWAHAAIGNCEWIVRYYSAWAELSYMFVQNEYCSGGSFEALIMENSKQKKLFPENDSLTLLRHVGSALKHLHALSIAHLDVKPGNIFIQRMSLNDSLLDDSEDSGLSENIVYKLGDLGHVVSYKDGAREVEKGDCRYVAQEVIMGENICPAKADILSLGMSVIEACGFYPLPKQDGLWEDLRHDRVPYMFQYSKAFNCLIRKMLAKDPQRRPTAQQLVADVLISPKKPDQMKKLQHELNAAKFELVAMEKKFEQLQCEASQTSDLKPPYKPSITKCVLQNLRKKTALARSNSTIY